MSLHSIVLAVASPALLFVILYYAPRALLMLAAGIVILASAPDSKRHDQALSVLQEVCKGGGSFTWWRGSRS
jgi:hypothetical protein